MRIGVDVMGGDFAPDAILKGCAEALPDLTPDDRLVLIGPRSIIEEFLTERGIKDPRIEIEHCTEVIGMGDHPAESVRKKRDSSIVRMAEVGAARHPRACDFVLSAGNTGACVSASVLNMGRLPQVHRPGIAVTIPAFKGHIVLIDAGANPEPKAINLYQYALMGEVTARLVHGIARPRIGVMNIGTEEGKGGAMVNEVAEKLRITPDCNSIDFIEGRDLFEGVADVVVADAFTGNSLLKTAEGMVKSIFAFVTQEVLNTDPMLLLKLEPVFKGIYKKHDYHEHGAAPLLGAKGYCFIAHGSSEARTIRSGIRSAKRYVELDLNTAITARLAQAMPIAYPGGIRELDRPAATLSTAHKVNA